MSLERSMDHTSGNQTDTLQSSPGKSINMSQSERLWSLIGGGALTLFGLSRKSLSGTLLAALGGRLLYRGATGHSTLYTLLHMNKAKHPFSSNNVMLLSGGEGVRVQRSIAIQTTPEQAYALWRDIERTPDFMPLIEEVRATGETTSHWIAQSPTGKRVEWDGVLTRDEVGKCLEWKVEHNPLLGSQGRIRFTVAPGGRGTVAQLEIDFVERKVFQNLLEMPLFGRAADTMLEGHMAETLRRFKALMEAGEIPTVKGQPTGKDAEEGESI